MLFLLVSIESSYFYVIIISEYILQKLGMVYVDLLANKQTRQTKNGDLMSTFLLWFFIVVL